MGSNEGVIRRNTARLRRGLPVALGLLLLMPAAQAANIYRYVDENGRTVFNSSIPPEYAKNGYTILDERGRVLQVVPRALTAEELAEVEKQRELERLAALEREKQAEHDRLLMRLYRSPDEIARKRDERLDQLNAQRTALAASLAKAEQDAQRLHGHIADAEAAGRPVAEATRQELAGALNNKTTLEAQIARLDTDIAATRADAERDMARLTELLGR